MANNAALSITESEVQAALGIMAQRFFLRNMMSADWKHSYSKTITVV